MADEATNITLLGNRGDPVEIIVDDTIAIPKNTLMQLTSSPKTCTATDGAAQIFIGILTHEKVANDGITKASVFTHLIADLTCGAAETMVLGAPVATGAAANEVDVSTGSNVENPNVGIALETVTNNGIGAVLINVGKQY